MSGAHRRLIAGWFAASLLSSSAAAQNCQAYPMCVLVCRIINTLVTAIIPLGGTLVLLMFTYGAVRYVFSADDPAGRKQGRMICIHSIVAAMLILLVSWIVAWVGDPCCPGGPLVNRTCGPIGFI